MAFAARLILLAAAFILLSAPPIVQGWIGGDTRAYAATTVALVILNLALAAVWTRQSDREPAQSAARSLGAVIVGAAAGAIVLAACGTWLHEILIQPLDPQRADMLIVIQQGIRRLADGLNPYIVYHVPWEAALAYGPAMWAPFAVPMALHADVRFVTIIGMLFVPIACVTAVFLSARRALWWSAAGWLILLLAIVANPDLRRFATVGHTPVYWPLLALLAWLVARKRWHAAAVVAGLLIAARSTMVAIAPIMLIAIWFRARPSGLSTLNEDQIAERGARMARRDDREYREYLREEQRRQPGCPAREMVLDQRGQATNFIRAALLLAAAAVVPFVPFALWDWRSLLYGMYGSYEAVMMGFVWTQTTWVQHTIGTTGWLLQAGWPRMVEPIQILVMLIVYALAWRSIRLGRSPLVWMGLALFAFSLTTLWPVLYIYFDVFLLLVCGALAEAPWARDASPSRIWTTTLAAATAAVIAVAWITIPSRADVDAGTPAARPFLRAGFTGDEREGDRTFAWVDGTHAKVLLSQGSRRDQSLEIECRPALPSPNSTQQMTARLNGVALGTVRLTGGWQRISMPAPSRAWQIGVNVLELDLSAAVSPRDAGGNSLDARRLSVALDRVRVVSPAR